MIVDRRPDREEYGNETPLLVRGRDTVYTANWVTNTLTVNIDSDGNPQTIWADDSNHSTTYQDRWPDNYPAGYYEWGHTLFPATYGRFVNYENSKASEELRLELLDSTETVRKTARLTFECITSSLGGDTGPATCAMRCHGSTLASAPVGWEFDGYGLTPPDPTMIQTWCGIRVYWYPLIPDSDPFNPDWRIYLSIWPRVCWMPLGA